MSCLQINSNPIKLYQNVTSFIPVASVLFKQLYNLVAMLQMIWDLGLLAPNGTIVVDNVLFFGDPYTKEGFMAKLGEGVTNFNELVRQDDSVHKVLAYILLLKNIKCIGS